MKRILTDQNLIRQYPFHPRHTCSLQDVFDSDNVSPDNVGKMILALGQEI